MDDVREAFQRRDELQIVDVREQYEWDAGRIEGALHLPLAEVMAGREKGRLETSRPVLLVCKSGNRSELASLMLRARGYDAQNLEGGMEAWQEAGLPFIAADGTPGRVA
jgi:rhodanese-related sulfurtransferase